MLRIRSNTIVSPLRLLIEFKSKILKIIASNIVEINLFALPLSNTFDNEYIIVEYGLPNKFLPFETCLPKSRDKSIEFDNKSNISDSLNP